MSALPSRYGITIEDLLAMIEAQNRTCPLCATSLTVETACVDHDHATGRVRAALCRKCNALIGMADERPDVLAAAIGYLREHSWS